MQPTETGDWAKAGAADRHLNRFTAPFLCSLTQPLIIQTVDAIVRPQ
jgi:hypothetical protein